MEQMEAVLGRLSEIESAAVALEEKAAEQKKQIAAEYEAKTQAFDKEIDAQTQEKLKTLNEKLRLEAENELLKMKQETDRELAAMDAEYSQNHEKLGELMKYSAVATKIRAMESRLLSNEDFAKLAAMENVPQAVAYLKKIPAYEALFKGYDETELHRGQIERLLVGTLYYDFSKIYRFCDKEQKKILRLYFSKFDIAIIKRAFRRAFNHGDRTAEEKELRSMVQRYTDIPLEKLDETGTVPEILEALKGTEYYKVMQKLDHVESASLFDYEMTLDLYYFSMIWKQNSKQTKGKTKSLLARSLGSQIDLLNMMWIYRAKKYYQMSEASTYTLLIPVTYKLHDSDIRAMVAAADERALEEAIQKTYYGKRFMKLDSRELETVYDRFLRKVYTEEKRQNPYSLAVITGYLYDKEQELDKLTTVLEGVRYGLPASETLKYIEQSKDAGNQ